MKERTSGKIVIGTITLAVALMFWFFVWPGSVWGATVQYPIAFGGDYDSVRIYWWEKDGVDWDLDDSMKISTFPITDSIALDDAKDYKITYWYWEGADRIPSSEFVKFTAGPATITSDQLQEIAHYVEETLKVYHGDDSWLTGTGTGTQNVTIYAIDTSGTDDSVMKVGITVNSITGVFDGYDETNSNGYGSFTLPTDSMVYLGNKNGYRWLTDTVVVSGDTTVTLYGYNVEIDPPSDPSLCRVYCYVKLPTGATARKIGITLIVEGDELVFNACDSTFFINEPVTTRTNSDGYFYFDVLPSKCLLTNDGDSLQYKVEAKLGTYESKSKLFYVPDAETYEIELF